MSLHTAEDEARIRQLDREVAALEQRIAELAGRIAALQLREALRARRGAK